MDGPVAPRPPTVPSTAGDPIVLGALTHSELTFLAEYEQVDIVPSIAMQRTALLSGSVGPLRAQIATQVPLWMAIELRGKGKCTVVPPAWLSVTSLEATLAEERRDESAFTALPFHYIEIATLLFKHASDDFSDLRRVTQLFDDIRSVRLRKIEAGMRRYSDATATAIRLNNVAAMEINLVRPFFMGAVNRLAHHQRMRDAAEGTVDAMAAAAGGGAAAGLDAAGDGSGQPARRQLRRRPAT